MTTQTKAWWEEYASAYQDDCQIPIDIHYGPSCPNEDEIGLLGDLQGKDVLEIGCGGGQCAIAFALRGARAIGLDISETQLEFARALAVENGVEVTFRQHDVRDLAPITDASQDIVFSAFALQFIEDKTGVFQEVHRVLRPGGALAFSVEHPVFHKIDPESLKVVHSYHDISPLRDTRGKHGAVTTYRHNFSSLFAALVDAGLVVQTILEPDARIRHDYDPWFGKRGCYYPEILDVMPPTVIFKAGKPQG